MVKYSLLILLTVAGSSLFSQSADNQQYEKQAAILVENDVFTSLYRDQYYSSGLFGIFSWLKEQSDHKKVIRSVAVVQRIYTPKYVTYRDVEDFDRPYAGLFSVQLNENQFSENWVWKNQVDLGWMGPGTLTGKIQVSWHNTLGLPEPRGWAYEIQNSPLINYQSTFATKIAGNEKVEFISESNASVGTAFNFIRQEIILRTGKLRSLFNSVQYNGQLGNHKPESKSDFADEIIFFYGPGLECNIYNSTIQGNLFGNEPPHVETAEKWIFQHHFGFLVGWKGFDLTVHYYLRSKETTEATIHQYAGVQLARRF